MRGIPPCQRWSRHHPALLSRTVFALFASLLTAADPEVPARPVLKINPGQGIVPTAKMEGDLGKVAATFSAGSCGFQAD